MRGRCKRSPSLGGQLDDPRWAASMIPPGRSVTMAHDANGNRA